MDKNNHNLDKEEILNDLFDSPFIAVIIVDKQRNNIVVNTRMCEMFGYSKEEILKTNVRIFHIDDEHFRKFGQIVFQHVMKKEPISIDYEFIKKDGTKFWAKISGKQIRNKKYALYTLVDIDESIKTKNYLQSIIDNFPFLVWLKDINGKFLTANRHLLKALDFKNNKEISGKNDYEVFPKENAESYSRDDKKVIENKTPLNKEEIFYKNDKLTWVHTFKAPIFDEKNNITGTVGFARDITKEKELQNNYKIISERLSLALEGTNDGLWDWNIETNEVYFSPKYKKMLGYEDKELKNEFSTWEELLYPEDLDSSWTYLHENMNNQIEHFELKFKMKHKDGHYLDILSRAKKVFNEDKKVIRLVGTHIDMSEVYKIQKIANEQTQLLKTVIDEIPYPVVLKNYEGKFILVNTATANLYKSTIDEMIGKDDGDYIPDKKIADEFRKNVQEIMDNGSSKVVYEDSIDVNTNKTRNYMSIKKPFKNSEGEDFILILANDITELNEKNKEISQRERFLHQQTKMAAMGEMLANIAHQWRQPLSIITTASTGLIIQNEINALNNDSLKSTLTKINETSQYLSKTIDDFRNYFNNEKEVEECLVQDIWESSLSLISSRLKNHNINIIENFNESKIFTLKNEIIQIFINILNNSIDALSNIEYSKYIKIESKNLNDNLIIEIIDNAGGINNEILSKVFEPYFTTKHQSQGTGIGLYMSQEIIVKHLKGQITVENEEFQVENQKFKGAKFSIILPKNIIV